MKSTLIILLIFITALIIPSAIAVNSVLSSDGDVVSIEGTLLMLDDRTPHVAVPVQAIRNGKVIAGTLSDEIGKYQLINLKQGRYQLRCQVLGGYVYYGKGKNAVIELSEASSLQVERGKTLKNIDFRFPPFKKGTWKNYDTLDGLADNGVMGIYCAPDGVMWFGTRGGGVSRYDGNQFVNLTTKDGLASEVVWSIYHTPDGVIWFGTHDGVSRYDGKAFVNFTTDDGLVCNNIHSIAHEPNGVMWFGGIGGVSRYDGKKFVNFTTKDGLAGNWVISIYRAPDGVIWFGTLGGVSRYDGKEFVNFTTKDGLASNAIGAIHCDPDGTLWFGTGWGHISGSGISRYDGKKLVNFTTKDGLAGNTIRAIYSDPDGVLWFGTGHADIDGNGVSRYDGNTLINFTSKDGLANNTINAIYRAPDGVMWFATEDGVSRYTEKWVVSFTKKDGLAHNNVRDIYCASNGVMWFATVGGLSRYDGNKFLNFTTEDGLAHNYVNAIHCDHNGMMWFATMGGGVSRYDGNTFDNFTTYEDGLVHDWVYDINSTPDGVMWFATVSGLSRGVYLELMRSDGNKFLNFTTKDVLPEDKGICAIHRAGDNILWFATYGSGLFRYDGRSFINFTTRDGLASNWVSAIDSTPESVMWFGTQLGLSWYDGKKFLNFTTKDGLAHNEIIAIHRGSNGVLWFGTEGGGVTMYDGATWSSLDTRDGLTGKSVTSIHQDSDGYLWFGTEGGVTRYRRSTVPPKVRIVSVTTDKIYSDLDAIPAFTTGTRVTIEYNAIDLKTVPEKRQYRYRIKKLDGEWRRPTRETAFDDFFDKPGEYIFEVQAIDRDLNYSEPASVTLKVVPPFYMTAGFLIPTVGLGTILLLVSIISATAYFKHRRRVRAYERAAAEELQDAREMQMSLMPKTAPPIEGIEIAGRCVSANTVGGDFFDYLQSERLNEIGLVVADVTGKGLKGAMNAVMTDGILRTTVMEQEQFSPASLLMTVNNVLKDSMEQYMNVTMVIGMIHRNRCERSEAIPKNSVSKGEITLTLANAAHHAHPLLLRLGLSRNEVTYRNQGDIQTLKAGGLPLGMRANTEYTEEQFTLQTGDVLILMTDGIIEAQDSEERYYSESGRLERIIKNFTLDLSAEAMVDAIIADAIDFGGDKATRDDDMTVVVAKVL